LLLLPVFDTLGAWYPLRFALGIGIGILFVVSETWINQITPDEKRGRIMGIYGAVLAAGFATGPVLIRFTGIEGALPFIVAAAVTATAALPPLLFGRDAPALAGRPAGGLGHFLRAAPTAMAGVFLFGFLEGAWGSFLPLYGVRGGLDVGDSALLLSALLAGAIILQIPIGWLADRMDRRRLLMFCAAAAALGGAGLPVAFAAGAVLWLWLFVTGGLAEGVYTASLTILGERFRGPDLAAASAALVMMYSMGSLVGPPVAGAAMDLWDPHGLPLVLAAAGAIYVGFGLWRARRRA
jgi:MFS family permease